MPSLVIGNPKNETSLVFSQIRDCLWSRPESGKRYNPSGSVVRPCAGLVRLNHNPSKPRLVREAFHTLDVADAAFIAALRALVHPVAASGEIHIEEFDVLALRREHPMIFDAVAAHIVGVAGEWGDLSAADWAQLWRRCT